MERLLLLLPADALSLLEQGGPLLWLILLISCLMWIMLGICYLDLWSSAGAKGRRSCRDRLPLLAACVQVLPMLGLLGTVEGMIDVFHVLASHGSGNIRGTAGGISTALITTMAGLVTSLSGFYFVNDLKHRLHDADALGEVC